MGYLQLKARCNDDAVALIEEILYQLSALSITITAEDDEEIFEPAPGTTPLWKKCCITVLFDEDTDAKYVSAKLNELDPTLETTFSTLQEEDWKNKWRQEFSTTQFGKRLTICPSFEQPEQLSPYTIVLDPGLAFGTGKHPTTSLCLKWLDKVIHGGETVIDYGCGSGILAMAASKLGAKKVFAIDIDPQAIEATNTNAQQNNITNIVTTECTEKADILVANILANPLIELAPQLAALVKENGKIALSGILETQIASVEKAYEPWFSFEKPIIDQEWVLLQGERDTIDA